MGFPPELLADAARRNGFEALAVWRPECLAEEHTLFRHWLDGGNHASMGYLCRHAELRSDIRGITPWARSVLVLAVRWETLHRDHAGPWAGLVASYARGPDYHRTVKHMLHRLIEDLGLPRCELHVDSTPLPERAIARRAGLGWIGKNRFLTHPELGGDLCLAEVITDQGIQGSDRGLPVVPCHDCEACLSACPTAALTLEGVDSRLCLSYHTTQNRGMIPAGLRSHVQSLLGCDRCLQACPHGRLGEGPDADPGGFLRALLMSRTASQFLAVAGSSPLRHLGRAAMVRNACLVVATLRRFDLEESVGNALVEDPSNTVRAHAAWALGDLGTSAGQRRLSARAESEPDDTVRQEITSALARDRGP